MKCPKCNAPITRKQFYDALYGKEGEHEAKCETCGYEFIIRKEVRNHENNPEMQEAHSLG